MSDLIGCDLCGPCRACLCAQRDVVTDFLHQRFPQSRQNAQRHADELLALLAPQPNEDV